MYIYIYIYVCIYKICQKTLEKRKYHGWREVLHKDKRVHSPRRLKNPWCLCTCNRASIYTKQKVIELQGEIDESTVIVGDKTSLCQEQTDPAGRKSVTT
jgi:hypothetical protein